MPLLGNFWGFPGSHPISSHFTHFPYVIGAPPAAVMVVFPRVGGFAYILGSPEKLAISSAVPTPTDFYSQKLWGFIFPVLEPWTVWSGLGLGSLAPKVSLLIFIHHM